LASLKRGRAFRLSEDRREDLIHLEGDLDE
jgi:hypothetical protein